MTLATSLRVNNPEHYNLLNYGNPLKSARAATILLNILVKCWLIFHTCQLTRGLEINLSIKRDRFKRINSSCSTSSSRRVNLVTKPVISHE